MFTIRKNRGDFEAYLKGRGIDIGCGCDILRVENGTVEGINEDGEELRRFQNGLFDFVYSSHCLEHLSNIESAIKNWSRVLKNDGHLYIVVPDWVIYEKQRWPSSFNGDHKHTFSIDYTREMVNRDNHWHISCDLRKIIEGNNLELIKAELEDFGYDYSRPELDQTFTTDYAVSQICIIARKKNAGYTTPGPIPYVEFGGGLGDIINQMFRTPNYRYFEGITEKTAALLITHNPYAAEIFRYHPRKELIEVIMEPWVHPHEAEEKIRIPLLHEGYVRIMPSLTASSPVHIYPSSEDKQIIDTVVYDNNSPGERPVKQDHGYAVIHPYAGTRERDIPVDVVKSVINHVISMYNLKVVLVGRSYERIGVDRSEEKGDLFMESGTPDSPVINLIDRLTVPGVIELVKNGSLFFGSHSSINIAAWHFNKPCVVLYDKATKERHFERTDEWSFGKDNCTTRHGLYEDFSVSMFDQVLQ
jgi:SAM-dependent methyltransferase